MIAALFVIVTILIAIYVVVGVETAMAAHATGRGYSGEDDHNLDKAHMYLSWATSITWISIGLSLVAVILLIIVGVFGAAVVIPEVAVTSAFVAAGVAVHKNEQQMHKGFLGIQSLNEMTGIVGAVFKIFFFGVLMLMTGVGVLSFLGLIYILRSASKSGLWNAFAAVILAFLPLILVIILEIINHRYVSRKREEIAVQKQEITEMRKDAIRANIAAKTAVKTTSTTTTVPVAKTTSVTSAPATVPTTVTKVTSTPATATVPKVATPTTVTKVTSVPVTTPATATVPKVATPTSTSATSSLYSFVNSATKLYEF